MKLAIVYDRVNKFGGAERVLQELHKIWPDAPIYTAVYDRARAGWTKGIRVHPSFMQHVPFARRHHEWFPWAAPMAFESFDFDGYDVVLSVTSAEAKDVITKPGTRHICYCLTPTRYLWSGIGEYAKRAGWFASFMLKKLSPILRAWDLVGASRPDHYVAISKRVAHRIWKYYHRTCDAIIYPPVDTKTFCLPKENQKSEGYFLLVSRLVAYKRIDVVIDAFNDLGWPLVIIGTGQERQKLKSRARANIRFVSIHLTDTDLALYYQKSRAFVFAGDEDFGIVALEAAACGRPVICYRESGMAETVVDGKTGILFDAQTKESLTLALQKFDKGWYDSHSCREYAMRFSTERFVREMKKTVEKLSHTL